MAEKWKMRISGVVTRGDGNARVAVARSEYAMDALSADCYRLSANGLPTFELTLTELETYRQFNQLEITEGEWP